MTRLAVATEVARARQTVAIAERRPRPGLETSTHNSGATHAGVYYSKDSLKAPLCVELARLVFEFCVRLPRDCQAREKDD